MVTERDANGHQVIEGGIYVFKVGDQACRNIEPEEIFIVDSMGG